MKLSDFITGVGRPVAFYPGLRKITGSTNATVFICQLIYWTGKEEGKDGWVYKTSDEIESETGLSYYEQKTAREKLVEAGLLSEKYARLEHQIYFKVHLDTLNEKWGNAEKPVPECDNPSLGNEETPHSLNSNTETTTETTSDKPPKKPNVQLRGIEASIAMGRPTKEDDLLPEQKPYVNTLEELAKGFHYNFPRYGENQKLDRIIKLIVKDGRPVPVFVSWAKAHKRGE